MATTSTTKIRMSETSETPDELPEYHHETVRRETERRRPVRGRARPWRLAPLAGHRVADCARRGSDLVFGGAPAADHGDAVHGARHRARDSDGGGWLETAGAGPR